MFCIIFYISKKNVFISFNCSCFVSVLYIDINEWISSGLVMSVYNGVVISKKHPEFNLLFCCTGGF